jgi:hypothetical protein
MTGVLAVVALLLAASVLTGCGEGGSTTAGDPASDPPAARVPGMPTAVPAAPGPVHTRAPTTVMDDGSAVLCLGPVAESFPPQCDGPDLAGWDWSEHQGTSREASGHRWGQYSVSGRWDGHALTVTSAVPAAAYDPRAVPDPVDGPPGTKTPAADLGRIVREVTGLPGALGAQADRGRVVVEVVYDDGSLQAWADETYGHDLVVVTPALVDGP